MAKTLVNELLSMEADTGVDPSNVVAVDVSPIDEEVVEAMRETTDVGTAIDTGETLTELQTALEEICATRTPTSTELKLIRMAADRVVRRHPGLSSVSFESYGDNVVLTQEALSGMASKVWDAIKKAMSTLIEGVGTIWKKFVFWCKSATAQITQFRKELSGSDVQAKVETITLKTPEAFYSGLGNGDNPAEIIHQLEKAVNYTNGELFYKMARYASDGEPEPEIDDSQFEGLPGEPRLSTNQRGAVFTCDVPRVRDDRISVPDVQFMIEWCTAFINECIDFNKDYEKFKSAAQKAYESTQGLLEEGGTLDAIASAGNQVLFARTHSCVQAMENWCYYVVTLLTKQHSALLAIRKAFV